MIQTNNIWDTCDLSARAGGGKEKKGQIFGVDFLGLIRVTYGGKLGGIRGPMRQGGGEACSGCSRLLLDEVAEIFEFHRQVNVVHHDVIGDVEDDGGEIQDAGNAGIDQLIGDLLGG